MRSIHRSRLASFLTALHCANPATSFGLASLLPAALSARMMRARVAAVSSHWPKPLT